MFGFEKSFDPLGRLGGIAFGLFRLRRRRDVPGGKQLYLTRTCVACHGKNGAKAIQNYPHLAGLG